MKPMKSLSTLLAGLVLATIAGSTPSQALQGTLPNPILYLTSTEVYTTPGGTFIRHRYDVFNKAQYPAAMFAPAPSLPPCGNNANSSRTWVDFFENRTDRRIYGFCALGSPNDLGSIWFATPEGTVPPSYIYIVMHDRQTNTRYRSNLADTTL